MRCDSFYALDRLGLSNMQFTMDRNGRLRYTANGFYVPRKKVEDSNRRKLFARLHRIMHLMNMAFDMFGAHSVQYIRFEREYRKTLIAYNYPEFA